MKAKKKKCSRCLELRFIYKSEGRDKYCQSCWFIIQPPKAINKVSDKRKKENIVYSKLREAHLKKFPNCQVRLPGCTRVAIDIHHLYSGCGRDKYFLDILTWLTVCRACHSKIHDVLSTEEAVALGLRKLDKNVEEEDSSDVTWGFNP